MDHLPSLSYVEPGLIAAAILAHSAAPKRPAESRLRVLVVDDDRRIADTTADVLEHAGFDARAVYSAESALHVAAAFQPDCLLSDVIMPAMNGVELAVAFGAAHPAARIVLISGQVGVSDVLEEAERRGLRFELLAKPIHPARLIDHLRKTPRR